MKLCIKEMVKGDRLERIISDETVIVITSPRMFRKRRKGFEPTFKGLVVLQKYPISYHEDFLSAPALYSVAEHSNEYWSSQNDEWYYRAQLRCEIAKFPSYWWLYEFRPPLKNHTFTFLFEEIFDTLVTKEAVKQLTQECETSKQWSVLQYGQTIPILRKYKIFNKLLDEMILVKLTE